MTEGSSEERDIGSVKKKTHQSRQVIKRQRRRSYGLEMARERKTSIRRVERLHSGGSRRTHNTEVPKKFLQRLCVSHPGPLPAWRMPSCQSMECTRVKPNKARRNVVVLSERGSSTIEENSRRIASAGPRLRLMHDYAIIYVTCGKDNQCEEVRCQHMSQRRMEDKQSSVHYQCRLR